MTIPFLWCAHAHHKFRSLYPQPYSVCEMSQIIWVGCMGSSWSRDRLRLCCLYL